MKIEKKKKNLGATQVLKRQEKELNRLILL
jgi:hypothetical protein